MQDARDLGSGVNQSGLRDHNARLVMTLIQRHGHLPGVDIARRTGLSSQTASVILRQLEQDGFVMRGTPEKGRVGKPSIPMALDPDGVLSVGMKIGRRSSDLVLIDIAGKVRAERSVTYRMPDPPALFEFLRLGLAAFSEDLGPVRAKRIAGIGFAAPFELWHWPEELGVTSLALAPWQAIDIATEVARFSDLPVYVENDATAAARAEHVFGRGRSLADFACFFLGTFVGGGVVLNHSVYAGHTGNAGALGSLPVGPGGRQLIDAASIFLLENRLAKAGIDGQGLWTRPQDWSPFEAQVAPWIDETAAALAPAVIAVAAVLDVEAVLIDGGFPADIRTRLVGAVREALAGQDRRGLHLPAVEEGRVGPDARAIGAACAPIFDRFLLSTPARRVPA